MLNKAYLQSGRTEESDECLTPRYVVEPIIKYLKEKSKKQKEKLNDYEFERDSLSK